MKIAFFGGDVFYLCMEQIIKSGHTIVSLHTMQPVSGEYDMTRFASNFAKKLKIPIFRSKPTTEDIIRLKNMGCEAIVCAGYSYKVPDWENFGISYAVNIHPSLLPEGAGPMPLPYIILNKFNKSGATIHKVSNSWDAGDILLQEEFNIYENYNIENLYCKSYEIAVKLLEKFLLSPGLFWQKSTKQDLKKRVYWPRPKPDELLADFNQKPDFFIPRLKAHCLVTLNGDFEYINNISHSESKHDIKPGTLLNEVNNRRCVATADGYAFFTMQRRPASDYINPKTAFIAKT